MKSGKNTRNSIKFYVISLLFILVGLILINVKFNILDYSLIGIGAVLLILGIDETIKSI